MAQVKYLTTAGLSKKLGNRGRTTIYRDIAQGRLPKPIKLGGRNYFVDEEVDKRMAENAKPDQKTDAQNKPT